MSHADAALSRIGPFALEERLGNPPADHVYRGVHIQQRQSFAVRILPPEVLRGPLADRTFKEEVATLKALVHPHIVHCYGGSIDRGRPFLALELVPGESLAGQLARRGRLPWETAVEIAQPLCRALSFVHSREILHERLSPDKILIDEVATVKLCGFGSAWVDRHLGRGPKELPLEKARFLAPEQLAGDLPVTVRSDLYGVGAVLFAMLTGRAPLADAGSIADLLQAKQAGDPPRVSAFEFDVPVWLDVLVARLLAPIPTDRYSTAEEVIEALEETKRNVASGVTTAQRTLASRSARLVPAADREELERIRRKRIKKKDTSPFYERAWFLGLCLAVVVGVITWALWPPSEEELYRGAAPLMASEDPADWYRARDKYLVRLRDRFPDGKHAAQVQVWFDQIALEQAENRLRLNTRLGKPPRNEAERLFAEAWRYEQFGDRLSALTKYRALVSLLSDSDQEEGDPFIKAASINLAEEKIAQLTTGDDEVEAEFDRVEFLEGRLASADELASSGRLMDARLIWEGIVALYEGNRELEPFVEQARERIAAQE